MELCSTYDIKAIAEEIDNTCVSIAKNISDEISITYKIIEPTPTEIQELDIEESHRIIWELLNRFDLENWEDRPVEATAEYNTRIENTYRQREAEWLKRINTLNIWTVLIICGADHYEPFYELLVSSGIEVIKEEDRWGL